tara:strand:- start:6 stop:500 length:495 start_codon:yes stop_codon:yes gene_type:complete
MAIEYPSKDLILNKLTYNPVNGSFFSKVSSREVGYTDGDGYIVINIYNQEFRAHRLALIVSDFDVKGLEVDHKNGIRNDNKLSNLVPVTKSINAKNKRLRSNNNTGLHGVSWAKELNKWRARISTSKNRYTSLGCFDSFIEACCARKSAEIKHGYHENHGRSFL